MHTSLMLHFYAYTERVYIFPRQFILCQNDNLDWLFFSQSKKCETPLSFTLLVTYHLYCNITIYWIIYLCIHWKCLNIEKLRCVWKYLTYLMVSKFIFLRQVFYFYLLISVAVHMQYVANLDFAYVTTMLLEDEQNRNISML